MEILSLLSEEPSHGYELHKELGITTSTVYTHLEELEEAGMVEETEGDERKNEYHITNDGQQLLELLR
jgi:DNA-binding PadR family transcriptional regulator